MSCGRLSIDNDDAIANNTCINTSSVRLVVRLVVDTSVGISLVAIKCCITSGPVRGSRGVLGAQLGTWLGTTLRISFGFLLGSPFAITVETALGTALVVGIALGSELGMWVGLRVRAWLPIM